MSDANANELYRRYRPTSFKQVKGQDEAIKQLAEMLKNDRLPKVIMLSGPSGTGKTTLARIMASKLGCDVNSSNLIEINAAESRGIETVRDAKNKQWMSAAGGAYRIWIWDEVHKWTGDAQSAALKLLEDVPPHVYHFLCTTDPQKLLPTIRSRCTIIKLKPVADKEIGALLTGVCSAEGKSISSKVAERIIEVAEGSARNALVLLHQIIGLETEAEQLEAVQKTDTKRQAIELARAMMDTSKSWPEIAKIIDGIEDDAEGVRRLVFAYAGSVLAKAVGKRAELAALVMFNFKDANLVYNNPGKAALIFMASEVASQRK